ncbi:hypothetical protein VNO77_44271 [Canavalia gladiata]|uniref:Uncharacterized protein n=1 Tax=Canavalia gladiata TaxID=3824 RepID=A0AAN9JZD5_CANGL
MVALAMLTNMIPHQLRAISRRDVTECTFTKEVHVVVIDPMSLHRHPFLEPLTSYPTSSRAHNLHAGLVLRQGHLRVHLPGRMNVLPPPQCGMERVLLVIGTEAQLLEQTRVFQRGRAIFITDPSPFLLPRILTFQPPEKKSPLMPLRRPF